MKRERCQFTGDLFDPIRMQNDTSTDWIQEVADDEVSRRLDDPFCIEEGLPRLNEAIAIHNFFPRLSRGIRCRNGRTLIAEHGNKDDRYLPDIFIRYKDDPPLRFIALVDVERKSTHDLFTRDLPIHVPFLTMAAHRGEKPYKFPDGRWRKSGKMLAFERYPDAAFFVPVAPDYQSAFLVSARDIIGREPEEVIANGPFRTHGVKGLCIPMLYVIKVPRDRGILAKANDTTIEDAIMKAPGVRAVWSA